MNIITIDASGVAGSVAYAVDYQLVGEYYVCHKLTHSQTIMPMLEHLKNLIEIDLEKVDAIAVTSGPGSFTGLRIGVSSAKAMAMALEVPLIGIPTLDVMANNITYTDAIICPIMDARRNQVYTAYYEWRGEELVRLSDHLGIEIDELLELLKQTNRKVIFLGDGVKVFKEKIESILGHQANFAPSFLMMQRAGTLAHLACTAFEKGECVDPNTFVPLYLRKSQAEREREEREASGC